MQTLAPSLASNPGAPVDALLRLAADFPAQVAKNPQLQKHPKALANVELFAGLALASCPEAPAALLEKLAGNRRPELRATVAQNPSCPPALVERLALDTDPEVRATALDNPALDPELAAPLRRLASEPDQMARAVALMQRGEVQAAIAPDAPPDLLRVLSRRPGLAATLLASTATPPDLIESLIERWLDAGALPSVVDLRRMPSVPESLQRWLVAHRAWGPALATQLASRHDLLPELFSRVLEALLTPPKPGLQWYVDPAALARLLRSHEAPEPMLLTIFHGRLRLHPNPWGHAPQPSVLALLDAVLAQRSFSPEVLGKMATHSLSAVRAEAARHRLLPRGLLPALLGDSVHQVRRAAWASPALRADWRERLLRLGFPPGLAVPPACRPELRDDDRAALAKAGPWLRGALGC